MKTSAQPIALTSMKSKILFLGLPIPTAMIVHTPHERVHKKDIETMIALYEVTMKEL